MSDWTVVIRTALAALLGMLSLAASLCSETGDSSQRPPEPVTATVSDQPARILVTDEEGAALAIEQVSTDTAPPSARAVPEAIGEIRQACGDVLAGTSMANSAERDSQEFTDALRKVAQESEAVGLELAPRIPAPLDQYGPTTQNPNGAALLRQAARELEGRAADSEDLHQFEEADHLRRLSTGLRREARRWDQR